MLASVSTLALAFLTLASAAPATPPTTVPSPKYPEKSISDGFNLVVNVTDSHDKFFADINGKYINSIHITPISSYLGVGTKEDYPRIFYQNGTATDVHNGDGSVVSDAGSPGFATSLRLYPDASGGKVSTVTLEPGKGSQAGITRFPIPFAFLFPETYVVCKEKLPAFNNKDFYIVKQVATNEGAAVPNNCAKVRLIPECAKINSVAEGATADHKYLAKSECYTNVAGIKWSQYSGGW